MFLTALSTRNAFCAASSLLAALACGGSESTGPSTGSVQVTASTTGTDLDPDGYTVAVDGGAGQSLPVNGTVTFSQLSAGSHQVALSGVATNCTASAQNPTTVTVTAGATVPVALAVACAPLGELALVSMRAGFSFQILVMNADGSSSAWLTSSYPCASIQPAWSPNGARIAFASGCFGYANFDIWVVNGDGSGLVNLTNAPGENADPTWSPDGSRIAFTRGEWTWVMNSDGSEPHAISTDVSFEPDWSRDGTKIVYVGWDPSGVGNHDIFVMNADGSAQTQLTHNGGWDDFPSWSPDGAPIAFSEGYPYSGAGIVYLMRADGSDLTQITSGQGINLSPVWRPAR